MGAIGVAVSSLGRAYMLYQLYTQGLYPLKTELGKLM